MKEIHEFRIWADGYHLLPKPNNARFNGMVYVLKISGEDPMFNRIRVLDRELRKTGGVGLFGYWDVNRSYTRNELAEAKLFHFYIKATFEPTGEECGTIYDENAACEICGANREQIGPLKLKKGTIPKKDIAKTLAGEAVVSERFAVATKTHTLKGISLEPIFFDKQEDSKHFQLVASSPELKLSGQTVAGHNIFNLSTENANAQEFTVSGGYRIKFERTVFRCPKGHLIGARLISEPHLMNPTAINEFDFFISKEKVGAKQGLLRPEPVYFCSPKFRTMVLDEKLTGFVFEIAHIDNSVRGLSRTQF